MGTGEFALPVPRIGSIESQSGYARGTQEGHDIHVLVQAERKKKDPKFQSEVKIEGDFERGEYLFRVQGRIDGLYDTDPPLLEEIKSTFNLRELEKKLTKDSHHPYCLQLKTYGYLYYKKFGVQPKLQFHLVSSRTRLSETLSIELDLEGYEAWLERRLDELVEEADRAEKRVKRRKTLAKKFEFPFAHARPGQRELIETVEEGMQERSRMLIQAPTGLGKTAGVLYPVLKEAMTRGQRVVYVTPKNSQHSVAEDAVERFQDTGVGVKSLTITAKNKICFKNEPLCNPEYCEYAKEHYTKIEKFRLKEILNKRKRKLTAKVFRALGEEYEVCPFELQLEGAEEADVVICDYNYVFGPRSALGKVSQRSLGEEGKPSLVIDEVHNLFSRALGYYSPELSTFTLERMRPQVRELPDRFKADAENLLDACIAAVVECHPEDAKTVLEINPPIEPFLEQDAELRTFLSRYLESDVDIQPKDVVLRMCFYWGEFTAALDFIGASHQEEFFTTFRPDKKGGGTIRITCCDASKMLKECYDEFDQVVGFSATLKPFDYYAQLSGLDPKTIKTAEFRSPFPRKHRKLLIIPEISTKYSDRERNFGKIAEVISRISQVKPGNYFAFFPSFEFLERVLEKFQAPEGFTTIRQQREMRAKEIDTVLNHLKEKAEPTVVFAVQGGVFSEGVDYPGEMVIGAFIVGPPLPPFELEREKMRAYYEEHYGSGFDYTYSFPAMAKAVQAAGRVVRSETDRGLIVLMDNRFITNSYSRSMPGDWFEETPRELVSRSILKEVQDFWAEVAPAEPLPCL